MNEYICILPPQEKSEANKPPYSKIVEPVSIQPGYPCESFILSRDPGEDVLQ